MKEEIIAIFGASSTWGAWDFEKGGWANRLRLFFDKNDSNIFAYNLGISGNNSKGILNRIKIECEARCPTIIIISIGDNDSVENSYVYNSPEQFEENLIKSIKIAKKFTNKIVLLGTKKVDESKTNPVSWDKNINYLNKNINKYDLIIEDVANKEKVKYLKMSDLINKEDLEDGLHPNSEGHKKIFEKVKEFLLNEFIEVK